jgi:ABC-2 type transport system permease protein
MTPASGGFGRVLTREVRRLVRSPRAWLLFAVLPAMAAAVLVRVLWAEVPADLPVAVVDLDRSALSRQVARMIDATPSVRVAAVAGSTGEGAQLARAGRVYGTITVPRAFERDVLRGAAPSLIVDYNAQWLVPGSLLRRDARAAGATLSAVVEAAGRQARGQGRADARAQVEPIRVHAHALFNPQLNYAHFLLPALLPAMLQLFVLLAAIAVVGEELKRGTAGDWLEAAGGRLAPAIAGKLAPVIAWFSLAGLAMVWLLFRTLGAPMRGDWVVLAGATLLLVVAYAGIGLLVAAWTANLRLAISLGAFYGGIAFAFVGVTFPLTAMPLPAWAWSQALPLTPYLSLVFEQAMRGAPVHESRPELLVLSGFAALSFAAAWWRTGRVARDPRYWGRT